MLLWHGNALQERSTPIQRRRTRRTNPSGQVPKLQLYKHFVIIYQKTLVQSNSNLLSWQLRPDTEWLNRTKTWTPLNRIKCLVHPAEHQDINERLQRVLTSNFHPPATTESRSVLHSVSMQYIVLRMELENENISSLDRREENVAQETVLTSLVIVLVFRSSSGNELTWQF